MEPGPAFFISRATVPAPSARSRRERPGGATFSRRPRPPGRCNAAGAAGRDRDAAPVVGGEGAVCFFGWNADYQRGAHFGGKPKINKTDLAARWRLHPWRSRSSRVLNTPSAAETSSSSGGNPMSTREARRRSSRRTSCRSDAVRASNASMIFFAASPMGLFCPGLFTQSMPANRTEHGHEHLRCALSCPGMVGKHYAVPGTAPTPNYLAFTNETRPRRRHRLSILMTVGLEVASRRCLAGRTWLRIPGRISTVGGFANADEPDRAIWPVERQANEQSQPGTDRSIRFA